MARVNLGDLFDAPDQAQQPAAPEPDVEAPRSTTPSVTTGGSATANARINFEVPRELRNAFKAWCSSNDTSVKDELTAYIQRCIQSS